MEYVQIAGRPVSRFIIGGNTFSGFSHQSVEKDREMVRYFTVQRIKRTLHQAEALGINTLVARGDAHIRRLLLEYWDEGGTVQWFCQTCPEMGPPERTVEQAIAMGACACYIHGGVMDFLYAQNRLDEVRPALEKIRAAGLPAGVAAHNPRVLEWAEQNLSVDFYMACYYNPTPRDKAAAHPHGAVEVYREEDRDAMTAMIARLSRPAIHYKVLAAGRNHPAAAFRYVARHLRPQDAVCVGVYPKGKPDMLLEDVRLFFEAVGTTPAASARHKC